MAHGHHAVTDDASAEANRGGGRRQFCQYDGPPTAITMGELLGAGYHQPELLSSVPAAGSGRLPHHPRAHARAAHESFGKFLAVGGAAPSGVAAAGSRAGAGLAPGAGLDRKSVV